MTSDLDRVRDQQRDTWDRFSAGWRRWDVVVGEWLAPFGEAMIRHADLRDASHVLDVASGTGEPGLTAAALVPRGRVVLTDLAERMLAAARENAAARGVRNVETRVCDAGALPFADGSVDAVLCRFGFMFFPDTAAAARELVRVARPGARVTAAVWSGPEANPWATTVLDAIARHVDVPAPEPSAPGLFRCAADGIMRELFAGAGLRDITVEVVSSEVVLDDAEQYWEFMTDIAAPVVAGLAGADEAIRGTVRTEVLDQAQQFVRDGRVRFRSTGTVVTGIR